jgi:hypothetical protein
MKYYEQGPRHELQIYQNRGKGQSMNKKYIKIEDEINI